MPPLRTLFSAPSLRRLLSPLVLVAFALFTTACAAHYTVIKQSGPPSALLGVQAIAVQYDYSQIRIGNTDRMTEEQWLSSRKQESHRQTYLDTKNSANIGVVEGLTKNLNQVVVSEGQAGPGQIQVTVTYLEWEEGLYAAVIAWPSWIKARIIFSLDGQVVDEIEIQVSQDATLTTPAPTQRIHTCGQRIGTYAAEFVRETAS